MNTQTAKTNAANKKKMSNLRLVTTSALTAIGLIAVGAAPANADNWVDLDTTSGSTTTDLSQANTTNISINSGRAIVEGDLDINQGWAVNVGRGDLVAIDRENDPTFIYGSLNCAGSCHVLDRNGVIVGATGSVDARSVSLSDGEIMNRSDFMAGGSLIISNFSGAGVTNEGTISVADSGMAALLSPVVSNAGIINAKLGTVTLASAETVTIDPYGDGLFEIALSGEASKAIISNTGTINAEGGTVQMTALAVKDAVDNVINVDGIVTVASAEVQGGKIILRGGDVNVSGKLDASGTTGGDVDIDGATVTLTADSEINADSNSLEGQAGNIIVWGDRLYAYGALSILGQNGFVETSNREGGAIDSKVLIGENGEWLIDPTDACIADAAASCGAGATFIATGSQEFAVDNALAGVTVGALTLSTGSNIIVVDQLDFNAVNTGVTYRLQAHDDITVQDTITATGANGVNVSLIADYDLSGGAAKVYVDADIATNGGNFLAQSSTGVEISAAVSTDGGNIALTSQSTAFNEAITVLSTGSLTSNGGNITLDSNGSGGGFTTIAGTVDAGTGDVNANARQFRLTGTGTVTADELDIIAGAVTQTADATITANILTGSISSTASFLGTANDIGTIGNFATGVANWSTGGFVLNNASGSKLDITGAISTTGGDVEITNNARLDIDSTGSITTNDGTVALNANNNSFLYVDGSIDTGAGDTNLNAGSTIVLRNGSTITTDELNTVAKTVNQDAGSTITANLLTGDLTKAASFLGTANDITTIGDFTTGTQASNDGGFTLVDINGVEVSGAIITDGGDIALDTNGTAFDQPITVLSTGSLTSNGGNITLDSNGSGGGFTTIAGTVDAGTGDVNANARQFRLTGTGTVTADELDIIAAAVTQTADATITANTLTGSIDSTASLLGTNNNIGTIGNFATGVANWSTGGFTLIDNGGVLITGALSTTGGDVDIDSQGTTWTDFLSLEDTGSISTAGGNVTLASALGGLIVKGDIDAGAGDIDLSGQQVQLKYSSTVTGDEVTFDAGRVYQDTTSTLIAGTISGTSQSDVLLQGTNNDITTIGDFTTGAGNWHDGGFTLVDNGGLNVAGALSTTGGDVALSTTGGDVTFESTSSVLTDGGNLAVTADGKIDVDTGATINLVDGDANFDAATINLGDDIETTGEITGTATIVNVENDGAEIQDGVDVATDAGGATVTVSAGTYVEDVTIDKSLNLIGLTGATVQAPAAGNALITVTAADVTIDPFTFDGANLVDYGISAVGVGADGLVVDGNTFKNFTTAGVGIDANSALIATIKNNIFEGSSTAGVEIAGLDGGFTLNLTDNTFGSDAELIENGVVATSALNTGTLNIISDVTGTTIDSSDDAMQFEGGLNAGAVVNVTGVDAQARGGSEAADFNGNIDTGASATFSGGSYVGGGSGIETGTIDGTLTITNGATVDGQNASNGFGVNVLGNVRGTLTVENSTITGGNSGIGRHTNASNFMDIDGGTLTVTGSTVTGANGDGITIGEIKNAGSADISSNVEIKGENNGINIADGVTGAAASLLIDQNTKIEGGDDGIEFGGEINSATVTISGNTLIEGVNDDGVLFSDRIIRGSDVTIAANTITGGDDGVQFADIIRGGSTTVTIGGATPADGNTITGDEDGVDIENINNATVTISNNTKIEGLTSDAIELSGALTNTATVNVTDNTDIIGFDDGVDLNSDVTDSEINITGNTNITAADNSIRFGDEIDSSTITISGNTNIESTGDDGIEFSEITGTSQIDITENTFNTDDEGIQFSDTIDGTSVITIGGTLADANTINASGDGIAFNDTIEGEALIDISFNTVDAEGNGFIFRDETNNAKTTDGTSDNEIHIHNNDVIATEDAISFEGLASGDNHNIVIEDNTNIESRNEDGISHTGGIQRASLEILTNTSINGSDDAIDIEGEFTGGAIIDIDGNTDINATNGNGIEIVETAGAAGADVSITNNTIESAGDNGIFVSSIRDVQIATNTINGASDDGIELTDSNNAEILRNTITLAGDDGIDVEDSNNAEIINNDLRFITENGIELSDSNNAEIRTNTISFVGNDGILANNSDDAEILRNTITTAGDDGIDLERSDNAVLTGNTITGTTSNGIETSNSDNADIRRNTVGLFGENGIDIHRSDFAQIINNEIGFGFGNGIEATGSDDIEIRRNTIAFIANDGIFANNSDDAQITNNIIGLIGGDGVDLRNSDDVNITNNQITFASGDGVRARNSDDITINLNTISDISDDGIDTRGSDNGTFTGNTITTAGDNGIEVTNADTALIDANTVSSAQNAGIFVDTSSNITVSNNILDSNDIGIQFLDVTTSTIEANTITNSLTTGIELENVDVVSLLNNDVTASGTYGLHVAGSTNGSVVLAGNEFIDNPTGARFESGAIDLTGDANTFTNTVAGFTPVGMQFDLADPTDPTTLSLVGNTIGTTIFDGFNTAGSFYVRFEDGALANAAGVPIIINGLNANFDGFTPSSVGGILTQAQLDFLEGRIFDADDTGLTGRGQLFVGALPGIENFEDFLQGRGFSEFGASGLSLTITGLPSIGRVNFAGIEPAAGDETGTDGTFNASDFADIEPAAGESDDSTACWNAAGTAGAGQAVTINFGDGLDALLDDTAACGS